MRYPPKETAEKHARILEQASLLFREHGFSGVSVSEIMKATGLTHGAFYNHFESKEDLISKSVETTSTAALASMQEDASLGESMAQFVEKYLSEQHRDNPKNGCLMAALAGEIAREPAAQSAFTRHVKAMVANFTEPLAAAKSKNARRQAIHTLSSIVGAVVLARAVDDPQLSAEIIRETRTALTDKASHRES
ncbi:TetR/AcrR family transcriptional regulator [Paraburkholderia caribensis]|uniref:TetR/AcrR family transcriptional regulator n=1 Tax=Paraburkholderia caribensis TaxID=75105 RepID=A0ABV0DSF0_9BURK|nr:TetR/AcrR family transcriptional regulator [Paraburkholderia caribensis]MCO4876569.1 TetR/AcrR family transcriptional regulator [Paraburkholderia caribensis]